MQAGLTPGISSSLVTSSRANAKGIISQSEPPLNPSSFTSFYYKHQHISSSLFLITNIGLFSSPLKYTAWDTVSGHSSSYRNFLRTNLGILSTAHILSHILRHPDGQRHRMQTPCQVPPLEGGREQLFWGFSQFLFLFEHMAWGFPIGSKGILKRAENVQGPIKLSKDGASPLEDLGQGLSWGC